MLNSIILNTKHFAISVVCVLGFAPVFCFSDTSVTEKSGCSRAKINQQQSGLVYIKIFGGLFPLPNRYIIEPSESSELHLKSYVNLPDTDISYGSVRIGNYERMLSEEGLKDYIESTKYQTIIHEELRIIIYGPDNLRHVLIHNGKQYIEIADEDPELWKAMFAKFIR